MRTMNTGFVTIITDRGKSTTRVILRRHIPPQEFILALTDGEIDRLIDLLKPRRKGNEDKNNDRI